MAKITPSIICPRWNRSTIRDFCTDHPDSLRKELSFAHHWALDAQGVQARDCTWESLVQERRILLRMRVDERLTFKMLFHQLWKGGSRVPQARPLTQQDILACLEERLGRVHARQRLGIESDHEAQIFGQGINFFHPENWYSVHASIRTLLKLTGLYWRGQKNTERIAIRHNYIEREDVPPQFEGFTILQLSDLHADMNPGSMRRLVELLGEVKYDVCVLTGDYRGQTFGPFDAALEGVALMRSRLKEPVYGVLGNHDTIRMVPGLEGMGIRMLLNESETITLVGQHIHLAGIDDAHYYRADNIQNAASKIPHDEFSILLSHTPEIYRQAAHADFKLLLSGHTHGGQICLPGSIPVTLDSVLPRHMGRGPWTYHNMAGYTSVGVGSSIVAVRFNCPPEITLHHLQRRSSLLRR